MAIIATGMKTVVDMTDGKSLSVFLGSNIPKTQIYNPNNGSYTPDWTATPLVVTPIVYVNQTPLLATDPALTIEYKRREGTGAESALTSGETQSNNTLTVNANKLAGISLLTYIAYVTYLDPDTRLPVNAVAQIEFARVSSGTNGANGADAKTCWISGEQVFKYAAGATTPTPAQITITANVQGVTFVKWQYKNSSGNWVDIAGATNASYNVSPSSGHWNGNVAVYKAVTSDSAVYDITSIYKVMDGANGKDGADGLGAISLILSNENVTLPKATNNTITFTGSGTTLRVFEGATELDYLGTGTDHSNVSAGTWRVKRTATGVTAPTPTQGGSTAPHYMNSGDITAMSANTGNIVHTVYGKRTNGTAFTLDITQTFSVALQGNTGAAGANAVTFKLYTTTAETFLNKQGTIEIMTQAYDGPNQITSGASFAWYRYASGSWGSSIASGSSLVVHGNTVDGLASFKCVMTYGGKQYTDVITLTDKTDNYQCEIISTGGDVFKNTIGSSCLYANLYQNGSQVDPLKSTVMAINPPTGVTSGAFYYKIDPSTPNTTLMKYNGSTWVAASGSDLHTRTYKWYRRDKDGNPHPDDNGAPFATGKVIYIDGDDVDVKTTFICEVE